MLLIKIFLKDPKMSEEHHSKIEIKLKEMELQMFNKELLLQDMGFFLLI